MQFNSCRLLLCVLLLSGGSTSPAAAWPPVPPVLRPFDDPTIDARYRAWRRAYEQSFNDTSIKLGKARSVIRDAQQNGSGTTEAEKQAAREFVAARKRSMERLRELGILIDALRLTGSAGDLNRLKEELNKESAYFQSTERNTLEVFEAMID